MLISPIKYNLHPFTWKELPCKKFTKASLTRFGLTKYDNPSEAFTRLKQTSIVTTYQEAFEKLSHRIDGLSEEFLIGCFIAGLKDEIRVDVKVKNPNAILEAIGVARLIEEQNFLQKKLGFTS
ncbi:hypothetical protein ACOSQ3_031944 [Xanthoceras sorbifolium]